MEVEMDRVTLDDIDAAEGAMKSVRVALQTMGREIYKMREGNELPSNYAFERYSRSNFAGSHYYEQGGPDWGEGTPILSLVFFWSHGGGGETEVVTLPMRYLAIDDWRSEELSRLERERELQAKIEEADKKEAARQREMRERATYERLRTKFGDPA